MTSRSERDDVIEALRSAGLQPVAASGAGYKLLQVCVWGGGGGVTCLFSFHTYRIRYRLQKPKSNFPLGSTCALDVYPFFSGAIHPTPMFNPRPAGPMDFPPPDGGGGGCLNTPRLSRLLRIVEQNGKRRSKPREKSFRNHIGHFLARVKIEVTRGQNSKIFQNGFWTIKSLFLKVEQRF